MRPTHNRIVMKTYGYDIYVRVLDSDEVLDGSNKKPLKLSVLD